MLYYFFISTTTSHYPLYNSTAYTLLLYSSIHCTHHVIPTFLQSKSVQKIYCYSFLPEQLTAVTTITTINADHELESAATPCVMLFFRVGGSAFTGSGNSHLGAQTISAIPFLKQDGPIIRMQFINFDCKKIIKSCLMNNEYVASFAGTSSSSSSNDGKILIKQSH